MYDDPDPPRFRITQDRDIGYTAWVLAGLALLIVAGAMVFMFSKNDTIQTADTNRPSATQPASPPANPPSTTGSGSTTR